MCLRFNINLLVDSSKNNYSFFFKIPYMNLFNSLNRILKDWIIKIKLTISL